MMQDIRDTVLLHQHMIDPDGVQSRSRNCLYRREYTNRGPNFLIHIDGYDKLKKYGFAIHGSICGFSRRVLWLRKARTNNDPKVIAGYFLQYVHAIIGVPRCIRMDDGTENIDVIDMQRAFRWNHDSCRKKRIEAWWRQLRRLCINFWMEKFSRFQEEQLLSTALDIDITIDYKIPVDEVDVQAFQEFCTYPTEHGCSDEICEMFTNIVNERGLHMHPDTFEEAVTVTLFTSIRETLHD